MLLHMVARKPREVNTDPASLVLSLCMRCGSFVDTSPATRYERD
jgi:hypothetical protein